MKIAIFGQYYQSATDEIIEKVLQVLIDNNVDIIIEEQFFNSITTSLKNKCNTYANHDELEDNIEALISIGGDGTILRAVTYVRNKKIPIVGINTGRLGFLATVQIKNIEPLLLKILSKEYTISKRSLLSLTCTPRNPDLVDLNFALNEVTVSRKDTTSMITIDTYLNGEYLTSYWADGLIISTPTGSTGYSLSCGGPVLTPEVKSLVITPIAPHNLNARPLVIPDDTEIELKVSGREEQYLVSLDSRITSVTNETLLKIKKTPFEINMIEFSEEGFLKTIRKKLLWGEDRRN
ncbi:inorganic polyphosphate kinase [Flavobacterium sp. 316]|uniref:NAD kinase n=1 Tax=Flavobacterium sediminilitoris TaxID=2024526 RepID=A0ABY4HRU4_9FLAO|nr:MULTISPECIES: NAD kinase [Flavobacterium]KIX20906.1 inorganic polyphosphate kinase [Flavobacterium sp. 316]UOX35433.1 NAD kinase [Flavobacterium sediminilitoris]